MKMRQPYWKPQHQVFIRGMLAHGDTTKAYLEAYPGTTPGAARANGIRLYKYPHIYEQLEPVLRERRDAILEEAAIIGEQRRAREAEDIRQKRIFLARVVRGEKLKRKIYKHEGGEVEVWVQASIFIMLRAIELNAKMEQGYSHPEVLNRQFDKILTLLNFPANRQHPVSNSGSDAIQATAHYPANAIIPSAPKQAGSGSESKSTIPAHKTGNTGEPHSYPDRETAPAGRNKGTTGQHPVSISGSNTIQSTTVNLNQQHKQNNLLNLLKRRA